MIAEMEMLKELMETKSPIEKRAVTNYRALNEAFDYKRPRARASRAFGAVGESPPTGTSWPGASPGHPSP